MNNIHDQGRSGFIVQPSDIENIIDDSNNLKKHKYVCLRIGGAGTLKFVFADDSTDNPVTINVTAGEYIPFMVKKVFDTGTTASSILGFVKDRYTGRSD